MSYAEALKGLLRPLGVYQLERGFGAGELVGAGTALDGCGAALDRVEREMLLTTAQDTGLEAVEELLVRRPVTTSLERRRAALAALLRIGGEVRFPDVPGIPDGFEELRQIIEDILPCHLEIEYVFWYVTWERLERLFNTWGDIEAGDYTWETLETLVRDT